MDITGSGDVVALLFSDNGEIIHACLPLRLCSPSDDEKNIQDSYPDLPMRYAHLWLRNSCSAADAGSHRRLEE